MIPATPPGRILNAPPRQRNPNELPSLPASRYTVPMNSVQIRSLLALLALLTATTAVSITRGQDDATLEATDETASETVDALFADVTLYDLITLRVEVDPALYTNPFDPADIELVGIFESPSGREVIVPGFWLQPYVDECVEPCSAEALTPVGAPEWQVRFAPDEVGTWSYTLQVRDDRTIVSSDEGDVIVAPSSHPGFVRVAPNGRYFQYEQGIPLFVIGHNLSWSWDEGGGVHAYERWLQSLRDAGGNYARVVVDAPWFVGLEWDRLGDYTSAQDDAWRLDRLLEIAGDNGIVLQLVLLWHQALRTYDGTPVMVPPEPPRPNASADWDDNPYNTLNGGPLAGPSQFFHDETAMALFRRRLRYIVARWGYSPQVFAWELIDEIDQTERPDPEVVDTWVRDMAGYLRQIDSGRHLITAGSRVFDPALASNGLLDFTEAEVFQGLPIETIGEHEAMIVDALRRTWLASESPSLLVNHSLNPWFEPIEDDPNGIHVQNALWTAALSGAAGGGVSAWGDTYIQPLRLQRHYASLAAFAAGVDWIRLDLRPAEAAVVVAEDVYAPLRVAGFSRNFREDLGAAVERTLSAEGVYPPIDNVTSYLYGQGFNQNLRQPQTYRLTAPMETTVEIGVRAVSGQAGARLDVSLDGKIVAQMSLAASARGAALRVPVSVGEHTLTLDNGGEDWLELDYIDVSDVIAPARVLTLRDSTAGVALAWLQHREYTWNTSEPEALRQPLQLTYRLDQMPPGRYVVELWNPLTGAVLGEEVIRVRADGVLRVELLPLTRQLALRAFRQPDPPTPAATEAPEATPETTETPMPDTPGATESAGATDDPERTATAAPRNNAPSMTPSVAATNSPRLPSG